MPFYEYRCDSCGHQFERQQAMNEPAISECPTCRGPVHRVVTGGAGFIMKSPSSNQPSPASGCSLESTGVTCCGRDYRCGKPACGAEE